MKTWMKAGVLTLLAVPCVVLAAEAAKPSCYDIRYSLDFLDAYPQAPAICEEVKEVDGVKYARMNATVTKIKEGYTVVAFKDVFGNKLTKLQVDAMPGSTVMLGNKEVEWKSLKVGDQLSFWLPERSLTVVAQPGRGRAGAPIVFRTTAE